MTTSDSAAAQPLAVFGDQPSGQAVAKTARGRPPVSVDKARARALIADGISLRATAARLGVSEPTLRTRLRGRCDPKE